MYIIKNKVRFHGNALSIGKIMRNLNDFGRILPVDSDKDDLPMDDNTIYALNVYLSKCNKDYDATVNALSFVGHTRCVPADFYIMSESEMKAKSAGISEEEAFKMGKEFVKRIKDKSIFNGFFKRYSIWGAGTGPFDFETKSGNKVRFNTYGCAPLKVFVEISKKYPDVKIEYSYENSHTRATTTLYIQKGSVKYVTSANEPEFSVFKAIRSSVTI